MNEPLTQSPGPTTAIGMAQAANSSRANARVRCSRRRSAGRMRLSHLHAQCRYLPFEFIDATRLLCDDERPHIHIECPPPATIAEPGTGPSETPESPPDAEPSPLTRPLETPASAPLPALTPAPASPRELKMAAVARSRSGDSRSSSGNCSRYLRYWSFQREKHRSMRLYPMSAGSRPASRNKRTGDSPAKYLRRLLRLKASAYVMRLRVTFATAGSCLRYRTSSTLKVPPLLDTGNRSFAIGVRLQRCRTRIARIDVGVSLMLNTRASIPLHLVTGDNTRMSYGRHSPNRGGTGSCREQYDGGRCGLFVRSGHRRWCGPPEGHAAYAAISSGIRA